MYSELTREERTVLYKSDDYCAVTQVFNPFGAGSASVGATEAADITAAEERIAPECAKCYNCEESDYGVHGKTTKSMCLEHSLSCKKDAEECKQRRNPPAMSLRQEFERSVEERANERSQWLV